MLFAAVIVAAVAGAVWFDRAKLKSKLKAAEAAVATKLENVDVAIKADIRAKVATIVADIKAWDEKAKEGTASVIAQFEARIKQIL